MKKLLVSVVLLWLALGSYAQGPAGSMRSFDFLQGIWKGRGWIKQGNNRVAFDETETVTSKLSGTAIQIEAFGKAVGDTLWSINDALGILQYNGSKQQYQLGIYQSDGSFVVASVKLLKENELEWSLRISASLHIKYIIRVTGNKWYEAGYRSTDGVKWEQTFEMDLVKQ